jgi:hypothetical protein
MSSFDLRSAVTLAVIGPLAVFGFAHVLIHLKRWFAHVLISLKRWFFPAPDLVWVGKVHQKSIPAFQDVAEFLERGDEDIELLRAATEKYDLFCPQSCLVRTDIPKVHGGLVGHRREGQGASFVLALEPQLGRPAWCCRRLKKTGRER